MEFLILLIVTLAIACLVAVLVIRMFKRPIDKIFTRVIGDDLGVEWRKFLTFALFVVGVSSGVSIYKLEKFIEPIQKGSEQYHLTASYWGLEIYRTVINTLGGMAWALLIFFVVSLIAFVIARRKGTPPPIAG